MLGRQMLTCEISRIYSHTVPLFDAGKVDSEISPRTETQSIYKGKVTLLIIIIPRKMSSLHTQMRELISLCDLHAKSTRTPNTEYGPAANSSCRTLCYYLLSLSLLPMRLWGWLPGMPTTHISHSHTPNSNTSTSQSILPWKSTINRFLYLAAQSTIRWYFVCDVCERVPFVVQIHCDATHTHTHTGSVSVN